MVLEAFKSYCAAHAELIKSHGGIKEWHTDNGGEFTSTDLDEFCVELEARHSRIVARNPQDNGGAERLNGILLRQTRIALADCNLSDQLWPFAFMHVVHIHNSLPTRAHNPPTSAFELITGKTPNLSIFHRFGSLCYVPLASEDQQKYVKTAPTAMKALHLGFDPSKRAYHVYLIELKR